MFTFDALDLDFFSAFEESRTALSDHMEPLKQLPDVLAQMIDSSTSLRVEDSINAGLSAWTGLQHLRARLTSNSIFSRASAVTLMAHEAVLCACMEALATYHSQRDIMGNTFLSAISSALWNAIDTRLDVRTITFAHEGVEHSLALSVPPRSLRTDFERQRLVYIACLHELCSRIGVGDCRLFRLRAWFVWSVVSTLGFEALYHRNVWMGWQYPHIRCAHSHLKKEPSLDVLLPLLGHLGHHTHIGDRPPLALSSLAQAVCDQDERVRSISVSRWFAASAISAMECAPAVLPQLPATVGAIYRSLAVLDRLLGAVHFLIYITSVHL